MRKPTPPRQLALADRQVESDLSSLRETPSVGVPTTAKVSPMLVGTVQVEPPRVAEYFNLSPRGQQDKTEVLTANDESGSSDAKGLMLASESSVKAMPSNTISTTSSVVHPPSSSSGGDYVFRGAADPVVAQDEGAFSAYALLVPGSLPKPPAADVLITATDGVTDAGSGGADGVRGATAGGCSGDAGRPASVASAGARRESHTPAGAPKALSPEDGLPRSSANGPNDGYELIVEQLTATQPQPQMENASLRATLQSDSVAYATQVQGMSDQCQLTVNAYEKIITELKQGDHGSTRRVLEVERYWQTAQSQVKHIVGKYNDLYLEHQSDKTLYETGTATHEDKITIVTHGNQTLSGKWAQSRARNAELQGMIREKDDSS